MITTDVNGKSCTRSGYILTASWRMKLFGVVHREHWAVQEDGVLSATEVQVVQELPARTSK
ncbi:hypothetical protein OH492_19095 [Vibrio chagasii]|nr:hypothetical protein [Vibrio chagasii]